MAEYFVFALWIFSATTGYEPKAFFYTKQECEVVRTALGSNPQDKCVPGKYMLSRDTLSNPQFNNRKP